MSAQAPLVLLPAVDVAEGKAVRLTQGKAGTEKDYGSPIDAARDWVNQGAEWIHLVDLDAAFGRGSNAPLLKHVVADVRQSVKVELSGGIRDDESLKAALATGCTRVNLGTAALEDPEWTEKVIREYGEQIAVGLDVRGHTLAARGWTQEGGDLWETLGRLDEAGCHRYVVTDVAKDGMMHGPNLHLLKEVIKATRRPVIASGGISHLEDIHKLAELVPDGIEGAIIGRALYEQAFSLPEALAAAQSRFDPYTWGPPQP
ncbi:MAG: bifunctional 1-(5-phosphoribosyl)-5-((5-phosphoribosylamino)methylideneamino)imidazole-4-carboxamide isomerase/phosphoribosylanthranilate isomerase PriA [Candidatus Nanopelagicales bacterium]